MDEAAIINSSVEVCNDERYQHGYDGMIDLTSISTEMCPEHIEKLVQYSLSKRKHGHGKWAVLVSTPAATCYAMIYHAKVDAEHPFSIFCSFEGAAQFLGTPNDPGWFVENLRRDPAGVSDNKS